MEIERNILIVDDSKRISGDIESYNHMFNQMKKETNLDYVLTFQSVASYDEAIKLIKLEKIVFDVLLVDYDLTEGGSSKNGDKLIEEVRDGINKHCKIIFYTSHSLDTIFPNRKDLVNFFNKGIYQFILKDSETINPKRYGSEVLQLRLEVILKAIEDIDFIQNALERYFVEYEDLIEDEKIYIDGKSYSIKDVIRSIRTDTIIGKRYKSGLAKSIIIQNILIGDNK